jgi:Flp pilus assembly pilin Flp
VKVYRALLWARDRLTPNWYAERRGIDPEKGASTLEWVVIAAIVFLLAVAAGAKITQVVNEQLGKIG